MGAAEKLFEDDPVLRLADAMAEHRAVRIQRHAWGRGRESERLEGYPVSFEPSSRPDTVVLAQRAGGRGSLRTTVRLAAIDCVELLNR